jgi:hypothetical protein
LSKSLVSFPRPYFWDALKTFSGSNGKKVPDPQHWSDAMKIKTIHSTAAFVFVKIYRFPEIFNIHLFFSMDMSGEASMSDLPPGI